MFDIRFMSEVDPKARLDGGDVLFTGKHVFCGLSERTNSEGVEVLRKAFPSHIEVIAIPVEENLHLKCAMTVVGSDTLVAASTPASKAMTVKALKMAQGDRAAPGYRVHWVQSEEAANVVRVNDTLLVPKGLDRETYATYAQLDPTIAHIVQLENDQFTKIDGALTCRSLLRWDFE